MPDHSNPEDEYFAKLDAEAKAKLKTQLEKEAREAEKEARRKAHWHRCGICGAPMITHPFRGLEIEVCTECGACLLEKGELEKLAGHDHAGVFEGILALGHAPRIE